MSMGEPRRSWPYSLWRFVRMPLAAYLVLIVLLVLMENAILYQPSSAAAHWCAPPVGVAIEDVDCCLADGTPLHAWWAAPPGWTPQAGAMLFCHGNGGNLSHRASEFRPWLQQGIGVLLFDYPGFGRSGGSPSEAGSYAAGEVFYEWLTAEKAVPADRVILYGGSLGSGVAVDLATRRPHRALVLVAAFTSIPDMAQKVFPWLPARWLARNQFDNLAKIGAIRGPVLILQGADDRLVPFSQGEILFAAAPEPKMFAAMPSYEHKDFPNPGDYPKIWKFLESLE
jgi:pimeloyl-ACP methyl ester carboxylesterase